VLIMLQEGDTVVGSEDASKLPDIGTLYFTCLSYFTSNQVTP